MAIMTINEVAKARSASWTGNYSLIWSGLGMGGKGLHMDLHELILV